MLIIPLAGRFDWRHPPFVTLILILLNSLIYFTTADSDDDAFSNAARIYSNANLYELEKPLFLEYASDPAWLERWERNTPPSEDAEITQYILWDRGFDDVVDAAIATAHNDDSLVANEWQSDRKRFSEALAESITQRYGLVPAKSDPLTFITNMFLHGGFDHLLGNMVFLFLFGFALERVLGSSTYLAAYLFTGLAGGLLHALVFSNSHIPTIGASGAVSGLMGTYIAVYRLRKINFFYTVLFYFGTFRAPALAVLPVWLAVELYGFYFGASNVAYWDHIGGLLGGAVCGLALWQFGRVHDETYLDETSEDDARTTMIVLLEGQIDTANFDRARATLASWLKEQPNDAEMWLRYAGLMKNREDDSAYDVFALGLFALADQTLAPEHGELRHLTHEVYKVYVKRGGPKPALKRLTTVIALARRFLADGYIDSAQQIANAIVRSKTKHPEAGRLMKLLSDHFANEGAMELATEYQSAYRLQTRRI